MKVKSTHNLGPEKSSKYERGFDERYAWLTMETLDIKKYKGPKVYMKSS